MTFNAATVVPGADAGVSLLATLEQRLAAGSLAGRVTANEIIPFPDGWDIGDLSQCMSSGWTKNEIFRLLNEGWVPTLYKYRSPSGQVVFIVLRLDYPKRSEKFVRPLAVDAMIGIRPVVRSRALSPLRPLYALDQLAARPDAPVLLVEGEKAADAAQRLFPEQVASTWLNGAGGIHKADWRPLIGKAVVIWPDNDKPGKNAATALASLLVRFGATSVRVVDVPPTFPLKWDLAEPVPELGR